MSHKSLFISLMILLCCALSACVASYKPALEGVAGYRDLQVDKRTFYVEYTESSSVDWEQVRAFALKRCAEIANENGYAAFDVISRDEQTVFLKSSLDTLTVSNMGLMASDGPVTQVIPASARVEGRRVTLKIELVAE